MIHRKWLVASGLVTLTALVSAVSTLMLQSSRAIAQTTVDCQILWNTDDDFQTLARNTSAFVAKGYVVSGFAAQEDYLYTLLCRK
jgi:hypothetical protein